MPLAMFAVFGLVSIALILNLVFGPVFGMTLIRHTSGRSLLVLRQPGADGFLEDVAQARRGESGVQRGSGRSMFQ